MGDLSLNFDSREFKCPHCGQLPVPVSPALVRVLQRARTAQGRPLRVVSGYRCSTYNARVKGRPGSMHRAAAAADVPGDYGTVEQWKAWGAVGIGVRGRRVIHVDVTPNSRPFVFDD
jgi:uncharacterized protein YcbK (DUF882 family)